MGDGMKVFLLFQYKYHTFPTNLDSCSSKVLYSGETLTDPNLFSVFLL